MVEELKLEDFEIVEPPVLYETETTKRWHRVAKLEPSYFEFSLTLQDIVISLPPVKPNEPEYSRGYLRWNLLTCKIVHVVRVRSLWGRLGNDLKVYADFQKPDAKAKKEQAKLNRFNKKASPALQDGGDGATSTSRHSRRSKDKNLHEQRRGVG